MDIDDDHESKANFLNMFFANNLTKDLDPVPLDTYSFIIRVTPNIDTFSFNWDLVKEDILKTLYPYKALGSDKISPDFHLRRHTDTNAAVIIIDV